jgi:hypothetical protein
VLGWAAVVAVLAVAGLAGGHLVRGHHDEQWVREHLRVRRRASAPATAALARPDRTSGSDVVVRIQGRRDPGTMLLEEAER